MRHQFKTLESDYTRLLRTMTMNHRAGEIHRVADRLCSISLLYHDVAMVTGVPIVWLATVNERESGSRFNRYFGNGDALDKVTVHVPKGRGPFKDWREGTLDAIRLHRLDQIKEWTWERACYEWEAWNGFGPRDYHNINSGYLWSGTNHYIRGKYTSDGHWETHIVDKQLGVVPLARMMISINPSLSFTDDNPIGISPAPQVPFMESIFPSTQELQHSLNKLGYGLAEDNNYGKLTRAAVFDFQSRHSLRVDGIAGPKTWAALRGMTDAGEAKGVDRTG